MWLFFGKKRIFTTVFKKLDKATSEKEWINSVFKRKIFIGLSEKYNHTVKRNLV